jgi:GTP pyrophosphokinase
MRVRIEDITELLLKNNPNANEVLVRRAYIFSAQQHRDQKRRSGESYLIHPLEVSYLLAQMGLDSVAVAVGLLHDVIEDTLTTKETLEDLFGPEVANIVEGVTKITQLPFTSLEEKQASNFRKMLIAMVDDIRVILVKLADRLHNMRTLEHLKRESQVRIATETLEIYVPIAHRLGMGFIKQEFEDLCFRYLEPEKYETLKNKIEKEIPVNKETILKVRDRMRAAMDDNKIPSEIEWRIKGIYSIYRKSLRLEEQQSVSYDFHDYVAFRIITEDIIHCYSALGILHSMWKPVHGQFDDYIANPKQNNYQSLHTVLVDRQHRFEVQIRTQEMHDIAEKGIAAHWRYKEDGKSLDEHWMERYYEWLRSLVEGQSELEDPQEFLQNLKADLVPDEIYTFTPKGKLIALPKGATPIDFAYMIHTNVGHTCVGAKVNGMMVPLSAKLNSGDTVEIITSKNHSPSRDWLNLVVSGRARSKIRQFINREEKIKSVELGAKILDKELHNKGLSTKRLVAAKKFEDSLKDVGLNSLEDLQSAVWFGKISPRSFIAKVFPDTAEEEAREPVPQRIARKIKKSLGIDSDRITVKGTEDILTYMAPCCSPVYGEDIVGYITRGKGVAIHRSDCPNVMKMHPDRRIDVSWAKLEDNLMPVVIVVKTEDRQGQLAKMMGHLDDAQVNLRGISAETFNDRTAEINMTIEIKDINHLNHVIKVLKDIPGVLNVRRI